MLITVIMSTKPLSTALMRTDMIFFTCMDSVMSWKMTRSGEPSRADLTEMTSPLSCCIGFRRFQFYHGFCRFAYFNWAIWIWFTVTGILCFYNINILQWQYRWRFPLAVNLEIVPSLVLFACFPEKKSKAHLFNLSFKSSSIRCDVFIKGIRVWYFLSLLKENISGIRVIWEGEHSKLMGNSHFLSLARIVDIKLSL